ncbi:MAG: 1,4-alpha-glucan branching protein GlgB [Clostridia bacterium]|nr:1,4-alpha-glucan branching protein GlgB [Clostridia bacterium]
MKKEDNSLVHYYFHEGVNYESYKYLGCHLIKKTKKKYYYAVRTWAPNAKGVSIVGDHFGWDDGISLERISEWGIWEKRFDFDRSLEGTKYKLKIWGDFFCTYKGDPYAFFSEGGRNGASIICHDSEFDFEDESWLSYRKSRIKNEEGAYLPCPINIYELHLASFSRHEDGTYYSYREMADMLVSYVKYMGYTHIELMPIAEYPYDGSWGYKVCGFYAPTSRFGTPDDFRYFISTMHKAGIGVILDWVAAHFPKDEWGLYEFDGRPLYEYESPHRMESKGWGTRFFDLGRHEVQSFLISNAIYWLKEFHVDGLRVDAVASMLYLDYDRGDGEWMPNIYGGRENLEAKGFLQKLNKAVFERFPDVLMIAEESTAWPGVTRPIEMGGLGFSLKWNMGWANDFFDYVSKDPIYRKYHHRALNFPIMYAFSENYILPVSHDEVVYGKGSFIGKMFGSYEDKFRQLRASILFIMTFPGKKLFFMGTEFGQFSEWNYEGMLDWFLLDYEKHFEAREYVAALNRFYLSERALWERDFDSSGFSWILPDEYDKNLLAYKRISSDGSSLICVISFSGVWHDNLKIRVDESGVYDVFFESEGDGAKREGVYAKEDEFGYYLELNIPHMSGIVLKRRNTI